MVRRLCIWLLEVCPFNRCIPNAVHVRSFVPSYGRMYFDIIVSELIASYCNTKSVSSKKLSSSERDVLRRWQMLKGHCRTSQRTNGMRQFLLLINLFVKSLLLREEYLMGVVWQWIDDETILVAVANMARLDPFGRLVVGKLMSSIRHPSVSFDSFAVDAVTGEIVCVVCEKK